MRPIPHRTEEETDEDDASETADRLSRDEAMTGEEKWLEVQEF